MSYRDPEGHIFRIGAKSISAPPSTERRSDMTDDESGKDELIARLKRRLNMTEETQRNPILPLVYRKMYDHDNNGIQYCHDFNQFGLSYLRVIKDHISRFVGYVVSLVGS